MLLRNEYLLSSFMKECCSTSYTLVYSYSILKGTRAHSPPVFVSIKNALAVIYFWSNHHLGIFILFSYFINEKNHVGYVMHVILRIYVDIILYLYNLQQANIYSLKIKVHEIIPEWSCFVLFHLLIQDDVSRMSIKYWAESIYARYALVWKRQILFSWRLGSFESSSE